MAEAEKEPSIVHSFRLPVSLFQRLTARAEASGVTRNEAMKVLLDRAIRDVEGEPK